MTTKSRPPAAAAIIVAAGRGLRFGAGGPPKQARPLGGRPVLAWSIEAFREAFREGLGGDPSGQGPAIAVVVPPGELPLFRRLVGGGGGPDGSPEGRQDGSPEGRQAGPPDGHPDVLLVEGGPRRSDSARLGLAALGPWPELILIHDGVRPLVDRAAIADVARAAMDFGAAALAVPVRDTLKRAGPDDLVESTIDRRGLWRAQTPQGFRRAILERALALPEASEATDEAGLVERLGLPVRLVRGREDNLKITEPGDLAMAEALMAGRRTGQPRQAGPEKSWPRTSGPSGAAAPGGGAAGGSALSSDPGAPEARGVRIGQGFDFHAFDPSRPLWLGCVLWEGRPGLAGHSDADPLAHALVDALLGAAGLGDIGVHFPPSDGRWRGAPGTTLLALAYDLVKARGLALANADLTVIGESPRVSERREAMIAAMALALGEDAARLNLKGKTTEGMGFLGRGEGLAASAVVLLRRADGRRQWP